MQVTFRVDASLAIGSGHVMRCLTLANALRNRGAECRFVCREHPGSLILLIKENNFPVVALPHPNEPIIPDPGNTPKLVYSNWLGTDWKSDARQVVATMEGAPVDWLIVDHYALDIRWEQLMRPHALRIMVIDDLADREHDCDLLLDQNLMKESNRRYGGRFPVHCICLLGPRYAVLQPQYAELQLQTPPRSGPVRRILVYFGGADQENITGKTLAAILENQRSELAIDVVINPDGPHAKNIRQQVHGFEQVHLHERLPSLAELMIKADLAIGAVGTTSWERCCLGLPTLGITLSENQRPIAEALAERGLLCWLGHYDKINQNDISQALETVLSEDSLYDWSQRCRSLLDGNGTARVVEILMLNNATPLIARLANVEDESLKLRLVSVPNNLNQSFEIDSEGEANHREQFYNDLRNIDSHRIYIIETDNGHAVGQVEFIFNGLAWEIELFQTKEARLNSLATKIISTAISQFRSKKFQNCTFAGINPINSRSRKLLIQLGILNHPTPKELSIAICSDYNSWINKTLPNTILGWLVSGNTVSWVHRTCDLPGGDICFYISYSRIARSEVLQKYKNNLAVHASDLPKGKGWSPASWLILEGQKRIPVTLFECAEEVDSGPIYNQIWFDLQPEDIIDDWREKISSTTIQLMNEFIQDYPDTLINAKNQFGDSSFYRKRAPIDSEINIQKSIADQFNLFRIADNEFYPLFFVINNRKYVLKIFKS